MSTRSAPSGWVVPRRIAHPRGTRSAALTDIQLLCTAGPYELDLLVREHDGTVQIEIVGQVTLAGRVYEPVPNLGLELVAAQGEVPVVRTRTDDFGEFEMECGDKRRRYALRVGDAPNAPCVQIWEGDA